MANAMYNSGLQAFLTGLDWTTDTTMKVVGVESGYTFSQAHANYSDLTNVVGTAQAIPNPTASAGVADGDDTTFPSISGNQIAALVIFRDTGVAGTSTLLAYIDTATGLPVTPNGGDITVQWDAGANKIFKL